MIQQKVDEYAYRL